VKRLWSFGLALLAIATLARAAHAHDPFEISTVVRMGPDAVEVEATMAGSTALRLSTEKHALRTTITAESFRSYETQFEHAAASLYELVSEGRPLRTRAVSARLTDERDVQILARYDRPTAAKLSLRASHLLILPEGYTSALSIAESGAKTTQIKVLTAADSVLELQLVESQIARTAESSAPGEAAADRLHRFVVLGAKHVLTGYDHLLFLFGVLMACRTLRSMLMVVTTFTVAHSLTLALAALGHISVSARIVEPLIAASIIVVGIENVLQQEAVGRRIAVTFAFGLVHGLGFAGALEDLQVSLSELPLTLFSFNLGVELGQLAVAALALPLLMKLHATERGPRVLRLSCVGLSCTGYFWFLERMGVVT
jgi:hydrogenase/urease accessory protein HupE